MRRRDFIRGIAGSAVVWPLAARAQQQADAVRRHTDAPDRGRPYDHTRRPHSCRDWRGLDGAPAETYGSTCAGEVNRIRRSAMELVALTPDVISSIGTNATVALQQASRTVPVCQRTSGFSAPDVNGFRHRSGSNKALACHSQNSPEKSRAVRVLDREKLEPILPA
jgi:hypothetical protein